jgi:hypothetical protein
MIFALASIVSKSVGGATYPAATVNGGKLWWRAYLPGTPLAVVHSTGPFQGAAARRASRRS